MCRWLIRFEFLVLLGAIATSGCSTSDKPALADVSGTLTKNGQPFVEALIEFYPDGKGGASYGTSDSAGNFTLNYTTGEPGAAIGKHTVKVTGGRVAGAPAVPVSKLTPPDADGSESEFTLVGDPSKAPKRGGGPLEPIVLTAEVLADTTNMLTLVMP